MPTSGSKKTDYQRREKMADEADKFVWKGRQIEKMDDVIATGLALKGEEQKEYVKAYCSMGPYARQNIGYVSGYYDSETRAEIQKVFETAHPIFGTSTPSGEEAFKLGQKLGEMRKQEAGPSLSPEEKKRAYHLFHVLWGKGVDNKEYVKSEWKELSIIMEKAGIGGNGQDPYANKCKGCFSELHLGFCTKRTCDYHNKVQP